MRKVGCSTDHPYIIYDADVGRCPVCIVMSAPPPRQTEEELKKANIEIERLRQARLSMTFDRARQVLVDILSPHSTRLEGPLTENRGDVYWMYKNPTVVLDGEFSPDELEAIAVWMREHYDGGET